MAAVTVSRVEDRLIAIKQVPSEHSSELEREAELLEQIDHPGVVQFVDLIETSDGGRALHTLFVSSDTWATRPLLNPIERASGVAALAAVLADLHDLGMTHRHLTAYHVLHGDNDRPVLCSLTRAGDAAPENRRIDLAALADLTYDNEVDRGPVANKLSTLADAVRADRLSARDLAQKLDHLLAQRTPLNNPSHSNGWNELARRMSKGQLIQRIPKKAAIATVLASVGIIIGIAALTGKLGWRNQQPLSDVTILDHPDQSVVPQDTDPGSDHKTAIATTKLDSVAIHNTDKTTSGIDNPMSHNNMASSDDSVLDTNFQSSTDTTALENTEQSGSIAEVPTSKIQDESTSDESISVENNTITSPTIDNGTVVEYQGRRYLIGISGDIVLTGDWDCDGIVTPAIVRPSTGAVVLFESWPDPEKTISMPIRWQVTPLPSAAQVETYNSCDVLRVHTINGSRLLDPKTTS